MMNGNKGNKVEVDLQPNTTPLKGGVFYFTNTQKKEKRTSTEPKKVRQRNCTRHKKEDRATSAAIDTKQRRKHGGSKGW
eukprot:11547431-Ditylum_brightwellii.AAC.1